MIKTLTRQIPKQNIDPCEALMDAVVRLTARGGIENVSVRTVIAEAEGVSTDVYLYRLFGGKEKLLSETFLREDKKLALETERDSSVLWERNLPAESRYRYLWNAVWNWLTAGHTEVCLFLARYYYCSFFEENTLQNHRAVWEPLAEKWKPLFPSADMTRLVENFYSAMLTAAFQVCQGRAPNDGAAAENGFRTVSGIFSFWTENGTDVRAALP